MMPTPPTTSEIMATPTMRPAMSVEVEPSALLISVMSRMLQSSA